MRCQRTYEFAEDWFKSKHLTAHLISRQRRQLAVCGARRMSLAIKRLHPPPTAAHAAPALDSATGGGQAHGLQEKPWCGGNKNNYDKMLVSAQKRCAGYDMAVLAVKPGVEDMPEYLKTCFLGQEVRICKADAAVTVDGRPAGFGEALSVYDWLCDRKENALAAEKFCPVSSLPGVYVSGKGLGMNMPTLSKRIHEDPQRFHAVMAALGAHKLDLGDIGCRLDIFPGLPMCLKFYFGDEEFLPQLTFLWDRNSLHFVRYETVYYIAGCLQKRLQQLL